MIITPQCVLYMYIVQTLYTTALVTELFQLPWSLHSFEINSEGGGVVITNNYFLLL